MQAGDVVLVAVSGLAVLLLVPALAAGPSKMLLAPLAFNLLFALGICESISTRPVAQGVGAAGFAAAAATMALAVVKVSRLPLEEVFRWDEFEAAFRKHVEGLGGELGR